MHNIPLLRGGKREVLQSRLIKTIDGVQSAQLKEMMLRIFNDFVRIIGYLNLIEAKLHGDCAPDEIVRLFRTIEGESLYTIQFAEEQLSDIQTNASLAKTLDSVIFAINHELNRVFERELAGLDINQAELKDRLIDAHEVLLNCFQQCTIILGRVFDPTLVGHALFNDLEERIEKSLILYEDLNNILFLARHLEVNYSEYAQTLLKDSLFEFQYGSRRYLHQQDWRTYDAFLSMYEQLETDEEFKEFLNRFICYVEVLLDHIQKRHSHNGATGA
jgi:hypothetical protein